MGPTAYDLIHYPTLPQPQTHPERLAAVGRLFGMEPAPVERSRVLEIGCGDGGNLIPMAFALAGSRFVGVDLAARPIAAGQRIAADLALNNLTLHQADLRAIDGTWGGFDYILAHGVYSWVAEDVREYLLAVCHERLAPEGIALISYNAYPGGHVRQMLREMLLDRTRHADDAAERIRQAREFLGQLQRSRLLSPPWQALRDYEVQALLDRNNGSLYHDDLAECNERFYFREFARAARRHGLEYLGEAEPHEMFDPSGATEGFQGDIIEREQYMDFLKARRFRQTLLCRAERPPRRETCPQQMRDFLFSAPARRLENGRIEGARGVCITPSSDAAIGVALALGEAAPLPLSFEELVPYAGSVESLEEILYALMVSGFADLHVFDFPCEERVTARPRANRLVRYEAAHSRYVTSACHMAIELDEEGKSLIQLLDGTRTRRQIARDFKVKDSEALAARLEWMAAHALLDG
jgi:methyltransferase-like protein